MLVRHMLEDLQEAIARLPASADFPVGVASYVDPPPDGTIQLDAVGSFHWDEDEFHLVMHGVGHVYGLDEFQHTARSLIDELARHPEIHDFPAFVRAREGEDASVVSHNAPLWGTGYHEQRKLVYFYYGEIGTPG